MVPNLPRIYRPGWEKKKKIGVEHHMPFYLSSLRGAVNLTIDRMLLQHLLKKYNYPRSSNHCLLYFSSQSCDKVQQERFFSFNRIPCLQILPVVYDALK